MSAQPEHDIDWTAYQIYLKDINKEFINNALSFDSYLYVKSHSETYDKHYIYLIITKKYNEAFKIIRKLKLERLESVNR